MTKRIFDEALKFDGECPYCNQPWQCRCVEPSEPVPCGHCGAVAGYEMWDGVGKCKACLQATEEHHG